MLRDYYTLAVVLRRQPAATMVIPHRVSQQEAEHARDFGLARVETGMRTKEVSELLRQAELRKTYPDAARELNGDDFPKLSPNTRSNLADRRALALGYAKLVQEGNIKKLLDAARGGTAEQGRRALLEAEAGRLVLQQAVRDTQRDRNEARAAVDKQERTGELAEKKLRSGCIPAGGLMALHCLSVLALARHAPVQRCLYLAQWHDEYTSGAPSCTKMTLQDCQNVMFAFLLVQLGSAGPSLRMQNYIDGDLGCYKVVDVKNSQGGTQRRVAFAFGLKPHKTGHHGRRQPATLLLPIEIDLLLRATLAARARIVADTKVTTHAMFITKHGRSRDAFKNAFEDWLKKLGKELFGARVSSVTPHRCRDMFITHLYLKGTLDNDMSFKHIADQMLSSPEVLRR